MNLFNNEKCIFSIVKNYQLYDVLIRKLKKNKIIKFRKNKNLETILKKNYNLIINCDSKNEITKRVLRPLFFLCCQFFRECDYFITIHRLITKQTHLRSFLRVSKWSQRCRAPFRIYVHLCFQKTI